MINYLIVATISSVLAGLLMYGAVKLFKMTPHPKESSPDGGKPETESREEDATAQTSRRGPSWFVLNQRAFKLRVQERDKVRISMPASRRPKGKLRLSASKSGDKTPRHYMLKKARARRARA